MRTVLWCKALPLWLPLTLAACTTTKTVLEPTPVPCPAIILSPELLTPLSYPARDQLNSLLQPGLPNAPNTKPPLKLSGPN